MKKYDKKVNKKSKDELQEYLAFRRRASKVEAKKGKGSYNRIEFKRGGKMISLA